MDKERAVAIASGVLDNLIKHQPNLFSGPDFTAGNRGGTLANYCNDFIEQYAKRLMERK